MEALDPIKVLVMHDNGLCHAGVVATLGRCPDIEVREEEPAPGESWADVIVTDHARGMALAEAATATKGARRSGPRVLVISTSDRECEIRAALARGVQGYLLAACAPDELVWGVRAVRRGERSLSTKIAARLADNLAFEPLTSREEAVLRLLVDGACNKVIASRLSIQLGTVKSHLRAVFQKLRVDSRTQAVAIAGRRGLLVSTDTLSGYGTATNTSLPMRAPRLGAERLGVPAAAACH